ncbi:MAG TPA: MBL fold metallo-hydrolase [Vicinamibacteria bacterium]|nr:MBL fold metallo-hydrolase [Vicinamibacteria bacterium]
MRRATLLGLLVLAGALPAVKAQPPAANAPKVIEAEKVKDNLWVLRGGGGNSAVFVTADGVTVVDAKNPGWGKPILDKIKELTPKPVTTLINTHTHGDHVSGNVEFPATVEVIAQENTKANMEKMKIFADNNGAGMAKRTFKDTLTLGKGADQIDLHYFGRGHTNGDAWVVFKAHRIAHAGDIFAGKRVPLVDEANGGSMLQIPVTLMKAHDSLKDVDAFINGHMPTQTTLADLKEYAEFNKDLVAWMQEQLKAGKTPEQAAAEWKLPEKYKGYDPAVGALFGGLAGRIQTLANEMKK